MRKGAAEGPMVNIEMKDSPWETSVGSGRKHNDTNKQNTVQSRIVQCLSYVSQNAKEEQRRQRVLERKIEYSDKYGAQSGPQTDVLHWAIPYVSFSE